MLLNLKTPDKLNLEHEQKETQNESRSKDDL